MAHCPVYQGAICSLCCTLEARCHDACKVEARVVDQGSALLARWVPRSIIDAAHGRLVRFAMLYAAVGTAIGIVRSEEHTSELQSLMRISYAVFCLKQKTHKHHTTPLTPHQ